MKPYILAVPLIAVICAPTGLHADELQLNDLFPDDRVLDVRITVDPEDWDTIRFQIRNVRTALQEQRKFRPIDGPYTYVKAKVTIDGIDLGGVGIRKKGFIGSQSSTRPSLKIKLDYVDKDAGIGGLTTLTLNNNRQDRTQLSQFMGYQFFNSAGSPAPRCSYAKVTVNGTNLGIYSHVETVRKPLLKRGFGTDAGTLYEGTVVDFFEGWEGSFENKVGDDNPGRKQIRKLIRALADRKGQSFLGATASGRAWIPTDGSISNQWTAIGFDDSRWKTGQNGAGYETQTGYEQLISAGFDFRKDLHTKLSSLYLRFPFKISDPKTAVQSRDLFLRLKYDDGFVAWLNGHPIAAFNAPNEVRWDSVATESHDDRVAVRFESFDVSEFEDKLRKGENVLAIQVLNIDASSTDMLCVAELQAIDNNYEQAIGELVDLNAFYRFWAIEGLLGFWDGYAANRNNYFVYLNPKTNKFHFVPWGADVMFEKFSHLRRDRREPISAKSMGLIAHRLYQIPSCRDRYAREMMALLEEHWKEVALLTEIDRIDALVSPHLCEEQLNRRSLNRIREFVRNRRSDILAEMSGGLPVWTSPPREPTTIQPAEKSDPNADSIWLAARRNDIDGLKRYLSNGIDINSRDESGGTALSAAALAGRIEAVKFLVGHDADLNSKTRDNNTALHGAAFLGQLEAVEFLLQKGALVNVKNNNGETPLDSASSSFDQAFGLVTILNDSLRLGLDITAVRKQRPKVAGLLRRNRGKQGAEIVDIWIAAKSGNMEILDQLLAAGDDVNSVGPKGITPIAWAAMAGQVEALLMLVKAGAKVDAKNRDGSTALHGATFFGQTKIVEFLIDHKADVNVTNRRGETPLTSAAQEWTERSGPSVKGIAEYLGIEVDDAKVKAARIAIAEHLRTNGARTKDELE